MPNVFVRALYYHVIYRLAIRRYKRKNILFGLAIMAALETSVSANHLLVV